MANEIGEFLRGIRQGKRMTQAEVLKRMREVNMGIRHGPSLVQLESGKWRPRLAKLDALSHGYNLTSAERTKLESLLMVAVEERRDHKISSENLRRIPSASNPYNTDENSLILQLLHLPKEARGRIVRVIQAFDNQNPA